MKKIGLIGLGKMGANHLRVLKKISGFEIAGACDTRPEAKKIAEQLSVEFYQDADKLLSEGVDCVDICVPTKYHTAVALRALENDVDVFVEKPIADTVENGKRIVMEAQKKGKKLMVGHIERFNPVARVLKEAIGKNGIISMNFERVGPSGAKEDVGVILDIGIHDIDLARHLSGLEAKKVFCVAQGEAKGVENSAQMLMEMENGASAQITMNWLTPFKSRKIDIVTKNKFYHADLLTREVSANCGFNAGPPPSFVSEMIPVAYAEPLYLELEHFLNCLEGRAELGSNASDSLRALEIACAAMESAKSGKIVEV